MDLTAYNVVPMARSKSVTIKGEGQKISFTLMGSPLEKSAKKRQSEAQWRELLFVLKHTVEPPLRLRLLAETAGGDGVRIASITATSQGFTWRRLYAPAKSFPWSAWSGTRVDNTHLIGLGHPVGAQRPTLFKVLLGKPNVPLIPELFAEAAARFS